MSLIEAMIVGAGLTVIAIGSAVIIELLLRRALRKQIGTALNNAANRERERREAHKVFTCLKCGERIENLNTHKCKTHS